MKIDLNELRLQNKKKLTVKNQLNKIESEDFNVAKPVQFELSLHINESDVYVTGNFTAVLQHSCVKCLNTFEDEMSGNIEAHYVEKGAFKSIIDELESEYENKGDIFEELKNDEIDVLALIREHIILEMPLYPTCTHGCEGVDEMEKYLDSGIDSRWQKLLDATNTKNKK